MFKSHCHLRFLWWKSQPTAQVFLGCWLLRPQHSIFPQSWHEFLQYFRVALPSQSGMPHFWHVRCCRGFLEVCSLCREVLLLCFFDEGPGLSEIPWPRLCAVPESGDTEDVHGRRDMDELFGRLLCPSIVIDWYSDTSANEDSGTWPENSCGMTGICCCKAGSAAADLSGLQCLSSRFLTFLIAWDNEVFSLTFRSHLLW